MWNLPQDEGKINHEANNLVNQSTMIIKITIAKWYKKLSQRYKLAAPLNSKQYRGKLRELVKIKSNWPTLILTAVDLCVNLMDFSVH